MRLDADNSDKTLVKYGKYLPVARVPTAFSHSSNLPLVFLLKPLDYSLSISIA